MPIFISFVCHWNYPELTYYKPAAAPAIHSTEARGKHIKKKKPGHAHVKYANCSFNEYKNTFCGRHGFVTQHITWQQWLRCTGKEGNSDACIRRSSWRRKRGQLPPFSTCTAKLHACIAEYMEGERCEMMPMPVWREHLKKKKEIRAFGHLTLWRTQRFSLTSTDAGKNRNAPSHKAGKSKIYIWRPRHHHRYGSLFLRARGGRGRQHSQRPLMWNKLVGFTGSPEAGSKEHPNHH